MRAHLPAIIAGGTVLALLVFWTGAVSVTGVSSDTPHGVAEYVLERYQTLLTGFVAIAAAMVGASAVQAQIMHADKLTEQARIRKMRATRAMLPLSLSKLMEYAEASLDALNLLRPQCAEQVLPCPVPAPAVPATLPDDALGLMRDYVEHADDGVAENLAKLIARLQVQHSRTAEVIRHAAGVEARATPMLLNLESYVIDCAEIYARASALFDHARGSDQPPEEVTGANVVSAMNLMGMNDFDDATIYTRVINRANWS